MNPSPFAAWITSLRERGLSVLPASHAVPVQLWAREPGGDVLHFAARGTTVTLRRYRANDLTGLILRAECDCHEHRTAGAGSRTVLVPGATPLTERLIDGRAEFGWSGVDAGLLDVPAAATLFDRLLGDLHVSSVGLQSPGIGETAVA